MISVPISNKVYRQKQEEVKNAKGNGDFDDLLDKIAECSREVNEKINNPGAEVITDSLRIREDNGKMGLVVGGQTVIPTEYEELIIAEDGFVLACKQDNIHLLGRGDNKLRIGQAHQMLVTVCPSKPGFPNGLGDGLGLEDRPVQILVTLLDIIQYV